MYSEATRSILVLRLHFELENKNLFSEECREGKAHLEMKFPERQLKAGKTAGGSVQSVLALGEGGIYMSTDQYM